MSCNVTLYKVGGPLLAQISSQGELWTRNNRISHTGNWSFSIGHVTDDDAGDYVCGTGGEDHSDNGRDVWRLMVHPLPGKNQCIHI